MLRSGTVTAVVEDGELRDITMNGVLVASRIYLAVRDPSWNSVPYVVEDVAVTDFPGGVDVRLDGVSRLDGENLPWQLTAALREDSLSVDLWLQATRAALVNRAGLCVLLPIETFAEGGYRLDGPDGPTGRFELLVEPQVIDADGTTHAMTRTFHEAKLDLPTGGTVRLSARGPAFEIEDQRNWTDGSWKAYAPSISAGFPYELAEGDLVEQGMTLHFNGGPATPSSWTPVDESRYTVQVSDLPAGRMTGIGVLVDPVRVLGSTQLSVALRELGLAHVRVDVVGDLAQRSATIDAAFDLSDRLGTPVELAFHAGALGGDGLDLMARAIVANPEGVCRILILSPSSLVRYQVTQRLGTESGSLSGCPVYLGAPGFFAEWNRDRPEAADPHGVVFGCSPQVHLGDDGTIMASAATYRFLASTIHSLLPGAPIVASPVTLRTIDGPYPRQAFQSDQPLDLDTRLSTAIGAAWVLTTVTEASFAGIDAITIQAAVGPHGVLGQPSHVAQALANLSQYAGHDVHGLAIAGGRKSLVGVGIRTGLDTLTLLLTNYGPHVEVVFFEGAWRPLSCSVRLRPGSSATVSMTRLG